MNTILLILLLNLQISTGITESTPTEQTYQKIGYTTQYGNGFNNTPTFDYTSSRPDGGPKRSREKPNPDYSIADWWHMNMPDILGGNSDWPSYVEPEYWEWFLENYEDDYGNYVREYFARYPDTPNNPFKTSVGDPSLFVILGLLFLWIVFDILKHVTKKDDQ